MARSRLDLIALQTFAKRLKDIREGILRERKSLQSSVQDARGYWKDDDYSILAGRHSSADLVLRNFLRQCDEQIDYIDDKVQRVKQSVEYKM
jgi:hypothetical protein